MITGRVFFSSKNAYFNVLDNGLNSYFGGDSDDRMSFFSDGASCSTLDFHLLVSMDGAESSKDDDMITGRVLSSPKNAYSNVLGNSLSSSFGGDFDDGMSFFFDSASCSTLNFY